MLTGIKDNKKGKKKEMYFIRINGISVEGTFEESQRPVCCVQLIGWPPNALPLLFPMMFRMILHKVNCWVTMPEAAAEV